MRLAPGLLEKIIEHVKAAHPIEGCGLVVGRTPGEGERFIAMDNVLASSTAYEMDPARLVSTLRDLRQSGEELVAIYHSHPFGPAHPSKRDIERAYYPEAVYLIVSLADPRSPVTAGFRISEGEAVEVEVHVIV